MATNEMLEMVDALHARKSEMDNVMRDITQQQSELNERRSHIEGRLCEIEYYLAMIEEK